MWRLSHRRRGSWTGLLLLAVVVVLLLADNGGDDGGGQDGSGNGERAEGPQRPSPGSGDPPRRPSGKDGRGEKPGGRGLAVLVTDVIDGDTVEVVLPGGEEEDVRYIGIDTPESVAPGEPVQCYGRRASRLNERLVGGRRVRLRFDAERRDRYGRLLAYVYAGKLFVNAELVRRGAARTLTFPLNDTFASLLARLEAAAGRRGRGLWGTCAP